MLLLARNAEMQQMHQAAENTSNRQFLVSRRNWILVARNGLTATLKEHASGNSASRRLIA